MKKRFFKAYTLTEVVVTILVLSVIVGVSIKIAKTKMDSIISYTYYSAYQMLNSLVIQINRDLKMNEEIYFSFSPISEAPIYGDCKRDIATKNFESTWTEAVTLFKDDGSCYNASEPSTLPRHGTNLCLKFIERINTLSTFDEFLCAGDPIDVLDPQFEGKSPDIILSNGVRIFNMSEAVSEISDLKANDGNPIVGETKFRYEQSGTLYNTKTYGYTVYVDIDGAANGSNTIWDDIYPFYITLEGMVIPAYSGTFGGSDKLYLQTSAYSTLDSVFQNWLLKSVSFKEAACKSGVVAKNTNYCNGYTIESACDDGTVKCEIKIIKPSKVFGL